MHFFKFLIVLLFICLFAYPVYAARNFYISEDEGGVYFQTDHHGGWYIAEQDLKKFKTGETGRYHIKTDRNGTYIRTEKHGKFYLDLEARKQLENEIEGFNREQEKRWEKLRTEKAQRKELEAQTKGKEEIPQDNAEVSELKVTVSREYRYPYEIWGGPFRYGRYGTVIHHKIRSPKLIDKPAIKKRHHRKRSSPRHHRNIPFKMHSDINVKGRYGLRK
jgi:hypothetical protein